MPKEPLVKLQLDAEYFADLLELLMTEAGTDVRLNDAWARLVETIPEYIVKLSGMMRNPHTESGCQCKLASALLTANELVALQDYYRADTALGRYIQLAIDTEKAYVTVEGLADGNDSAS